MKVLLTGAGGQLGQALIASAPEGIELVATKRQELDLADPEACRGAVEQHQPDWVLNAGAYTAVDKAESEPEQAHAVNAGAPEAFARALDQQGGRLLQISTDFVFNGTQGTPYQPGQALNPLGVYGASKAAGEAAVQTILGTGGRGLILRTSWVIGPSARTSPSPCSASIANAINWVLSPIRWDVPQAPSTLLKPVGKPFRSQGIARCQPSCTGVMPAPPAGTTWRWPWVKSGPNWDSSTRPHRFNRSQQRITPPLLNGRPIPFWIARPPEPRWTSTASTGSKL